MKTADTLQTCTCRFSLQPNTLLPNQAPFNVYHGTLCWRVGMSWWQGVLVVLLGNLITLVPMVLSGHPGTKYGVPFPVLARASFGVRGASLAAMLRCYCEALPLLRLRQDSPRLLVRQRPCPSVVTMET